MYDRHYVIDNVGSLVSSGLHPGQEPYTSMYFQYWLVAEKLGEPNATQLDDALGERGLDSHLVGAVSSKWQAWSDFVKVTRGLDLEALSVPGAKLPPP